MSGTGLSLVFLADRVSLPGCRSHFMIKRILISWILLGLCVATPQAADLKTLQAKAEKGDADAMVDLAEAHYWGREVELDWAKSMEWAEQAAAKEHPVGTYRMGVQHLLGQGVESDITLGQQLINLSAEGLEKRAKEGDHRAQLFLATLYNVGLGRLGNVTKGREWMEMAAEGGQPEAQYAMGRVYHYGVGVTKNPEQTRKWWSRAAEGGHVPSQYNLGAMLLASGKETDQIQGLKLLRQAVDAGFDRAERTLGTALLTGAGTKRDDKAAFEFFKKAAEQGNVQAQYLTGQALAKGVGVETDPAEAAVWLTLAARGGHEGAGVSRANVSKLLKAEQLLQVRLKATRFKAEPSMATRKAGAGLIAAEQNFLASLSFEELKKQAKQGNEDARVRLSKIYFEGWRLGREIIVPRNLRESVRLTTELAASGHADSQWNLGLFYRMGVFEQKPGSDRVYIIKKDLESMAKWMRKAADQDYTSAMVVLGGLHEKGEGVPLDYAKAMEWFHKAAKMGDAQACHLIGLAYRAGRGKVVEMDKTKAVEWFRRGAEMGDPQAQHDLGGALAEGEGVAKDLAEAREWLRRAAWQNERTAQFELGRMLYNGIGGEKDVVRGAMWINLAANNRVSGAVDLFLKIKDELSPVEKARARELVSKFTPRKEQRVVANPAGDLAKTQEAAMRGNKEAQYQLGLRHLNGTGVKRDLVEACKWFNLAALQNHAPALKEYEALSLKMTPAQINEADKRVSAFKPKP
ncbi:MAG: hypothetical protein CMO74_01085 [Verrucomicrobiales bacterium]|nr:hypothetical protein [Verrucomicrobiales bacterium]|tara:strand:- start:38998 stop:41235 length:2238 start_codon:yes stop_codon:yes gene_type:complete